MEAWIDVSVRTKQSDFLGKDKSHGLAEESQINDNGAKAKRDTMLGMRKGAGVGRGK